MKPTETLEAFLQQQKAEGTLDKPGVFTIDREKALQKIAEYQLPYEHSWVLKLCQAAVLLGATRLDIYQVRSETQFDFTIREWSALDFESLFFDPASATNRGFDTLRQGLWAAGVGQLRPFQIQLPGSTQGFVWNGSGLTTVPALKNARKLEVRVSVRSLLEGKGFPLIGALQAATYNWAVLDVLKTCAYTLPIPLHVDTTPISGYSNSATHGRQKFANPLRTFGLEAPWPSLPSPYSAGMNVAKRQERDLERISDFSGVDETIGAPIVALLTAHGGFKKGGKNSHWQTNQSHSFVCWVRYGVIIQKEQVDTKTHTVSLALHLPADHLRTDFTGFAVEEDEAHGMRGAALEKVARHLHSLEINFAIHNRDLHSVWKSGSAALVVGGVGIKLLLGPVGIPLAIGGLISGVMSMQSMGAVCEKFEKDFAALKAEWSDKFG